jgi:hypothetical protein
MEFLGLDRGKEMKEGRQRKGRGTGGWGGLCGRMEGKQMRLKRGTEEVDVPWGATG